MIAFDLSESLRTQIADGVDIHSIGPNKLEIFTPFTYLDGDHCGFAIEKLDDGEWVVSDEGDVISRANMAGVNLLSKGRKERLHRVVEFYGLLERGGRLILKVKGDDFADAFFTFSQACLEVNQLTKMPAERHRSPKHEFKRRVTQLIADSLSSDSWIPDWHHDKLDPNRLYEVDAFVKPKSAKQKPLLLFVAGTDVECLKASLSCLHYKQGQLPFDSAAVVDDEKEVAERNIAVLDDAVSVCIPISDKQSLAELLAAYGEPNSSISL